MQEDLKLAHDVPAISYFYVSKWSHSWRQISEATAALGAILGLSWHPVHWGVAMLFAILGIGDDQLRDAAAAKGAGRWWQAQGRGGGLAMAA